MLHLRLVSDVSCVCTAHDTICICASSVMCPASAQHMIQYIFPVYLQLLQVQMQTRFRVDLYTLQIRMLIPQQERRQGLVEASWLQAPQIRPGPKNWLGSHQARRAVFFCRFGALSPSWKVEGRKISGRKKNDFPIVAILC